MKHLFLLSCVLVSLALAQTEVPITSEPSHHLVLQNDYVRVFSVSVAPHAATLLHRHSHDYFFVSLGESHISNEVAGKPPADVHLADGEVRFSEGNFAHVARNLSDQPFRNDAIELLQDEKLRQEHSRWPEGGDKSFPGVRSKVLLVKDTVRVTEVNFDPGAATPSHHHDGPHLVVALSDLSLRSDVEGGGSTTLTLKPGEVKWVDGNITHTVTNESSKPARLVTFEFQSPTP
jgi:quercetin dioxygenase-like cupin family protein